ncbi:immunoglobulin-like domain-containing protein [Haladaptatus cibarius]|uniref:immunoglobulin-like domain-containing protein n=1 Tax=Haladaptatus cibarius TaxID=453847 RepID=UPI000679E999|nr:immunoglobulin-like domain-containing protein [Haladaptatus cibarius]
MKLVSELYSPNPVDEYTLSDDEILYKEGNGLRISSNKEVVKIGKQIKFEIENVSDEEVIVSPGKPYTLLKKIENDWKEVVETSEKGVFLTMVGIPPGNIDNIEMIIDESQFSKPETLSMIGEFTPGKYRFIYLGHRPFLAIDFIVSK